MKLLLTRAIATAASLATVLLVAAACYESQISHLEFETTRFGMIPVNDHQFVKGGMVEYQELSQHTAVVFDHRVSRTLEIPPPKVDYHVDVAFINADCRIVRVLTEVPPEQASRNDEDEPSQIRYSSGYPTRYVAFTVAPTMQAGGVLPGQSVKFTGPAQRMGCK